MSDSSRTQRIPSTVDNSQPSHPSATPHLPHLWLHPAQPSLCYSLIAMVARLSLSSSSERPMGLTRYTLFTLFTDKYLVPRSHKVHQQARPCIYNVPEIESRDCICSIPPLWHCMASLMPAGSRPCVHSTFLKSTLKIHPHIVVIHFQH